MSGQYLDLIDELLDHRRAQQQDGYLFPLKASSLGGDTQYEVHARRIVLVDRASLKQLPEHLQQIVWEGLNELRTATRDKAKSGGPKSLVEELKDNEVALKAARAFAEASFLGLVKGDREQALDGPKLQRALNEAISEEDQLAFFIASTDAESEQAEKLKIFRPRSQDAVSDGETMPAPEKTIRPVDAAPERF